MDQHKIILTDIDGVVFDWNTSFVDWMEMQGYVSSGVPHHDADIHLQFNIPYNESQVKKEEFNTSMIASTLNPYKDSVKYINQFYDEGWRFIGITSFSDKPIGQYYRYLNLEDYFPTDCFGTMIFLSAGETKDEILKKFKDTNLWYIDDRIYNINVASNQGLKSLLMQHDYNMHYKRDNVNVVESWEEIYQLIKSNN